ncbi:MAG: ATP synthase F1 subunit delta [bacterium]|nr:ATP synthase F1 subunit delta [bacterium]
MAVNDIARVYATSLVEVGQEKNILPQLEEELKFVSTLIEEDAGMKQYLSAPGFSRDSKKEFINKVFSGKLSDYIVNFLNVLVENDRQMVISDICQAVTDLIDIANNVQRVTVVSRAGLDGATSEKIAAELKQKFKKEIIITEEIDESILGGIIIKTGDLVIDGSLAKDLKNIRSNLLNSKVRSEEAYED